MLRIVGILQSQGAVGIGDAGGTGSAWRMRMLEVQGVIGHYRYWGYRGCWGYRKC